LALEDLVTTIFESNHTDEIVYDTETKEQLTQATFWMSGDELREVYLSFIDILENSEAGYPLFPFLSGLNAAALTALPSEALLSSQDFGEGAFVKSEFDTLREFADQLKTLDTITVRILARADVIREIAFDVAIDGETVTISQNFGKSALDDWTTTIYMPNEEPVTLTWSISENDTAYTHTFTTSGVNVAGEAESYTIVLLWDVESGELTAEYEDETVFSGTIRALGDGMEAVFDAAAYLPDDLGVSDCYLSMSIYEGGEDIPDVSYITPDKLDLDKVVKILESLGIDVGSLGDTGFAEYPGY